MTLMLRTQPCLLSQSLNSFGHDHQWKILKTAQCWGDYYFQLDVSELSLEGIRTLWALLHDNSTPNDVYELSLRKGLLWVPYHWVIPGVPNA